jgi:heme-degrading monooxygenase HmoA
MARVWTHGVWTVEPGREDDFVAAWTAMAREAAESLEPPELPWLLRDRDRPNVFISFGPWESDEQVDAFRGSGAFASGRQRMRDLLESFEASTLDEVAHGG